MPASPREAPAGGSPSESSCPTPLKRPYRHPAAARADVKRAAQQIIDSGLHFEPRYIYPCRCGSLHVTRRPSWDGVEHELLYEVAEHLQQFAQEGRRP